MSDPDSPITTLAGYRLVRTLGAGSRATVYLGAGTLGPAVLKVFGPGVARDDIGRELDALGRLDSPHCVRLMDVATDNIGLPVAILSRVHRGSIGQLLWQRESLEAGEAVTALAPLVGAVTAMHAVGVAHTRIGASSVHLGAAGEPVILGFGHSHPFARGASVAALEAEPAVSRDLTDLAALATLVLESVHDGHSAARVAQLLAWLHSAVGEPNQSFARELETRLFDLDEPVPIEFGRVFGSPAPVPSRAPVLSGVFGPPPLTSPAPVHPSDSHTATTEERGRLPEWVREAILSNPMQLAKSRLLPALRGVRRPLWVVSGVIVGALVIAIALVPQGGVSHAAEGQASAASAVRPPDARSTPIPTPAALPDDPVLALPILLAARARCIRDLSVLCLDDVDEQPSGAFTSDAALVRAIQSGQEIPATAIITAPSPKLIERLGDSALVDLGPKGNSASALMISEDAGWRIRGFLSGKQAKP